MTSVAALQAPTTAGLYAPVVAVSPTQLHGDGGVAPSPVKPLPSPASGTAALSTSSRPLTRVNDVRQKIQQLSAQSKHLDSELESLLHAAQQQISTSRHTLSGLGRQVHLITDEARVLQRRLNDTGTTAERISENVRQLDEESERIERAATWTARVADLKASLQSMAASIEQRDYAAATQHCTRALSIDQSIIHSNFAAIMVPTSEHPEPPPAMLLQMRKQLLHVFTERFEQATQAKDTIEATQYFTMFPRIGWTAEGLAVYAKFARSMVRERGKMISEQLSGTSSNTSSTTRTATGSLHHAALLTQLFEHLTTLIDQHQPLVDQHYGPGNFAQGVMPELQEECDRLGRRVCDTWYDERYVRRKLDEAKSYNFTFVASVGTASKKAGTQSQQRAVGGFSIPGRPATPSNAASHRASADEGPQVDTREVDRIVGELAAMAARWGTYKRFLSVRLAQQEADGNADAAAVAAMSPDGSELKDFRRLSLDRDRRSSLLVARPSLRKASVDAAAGEVDDNLAQIRVIVQSQLGKRIDDMLENVYVPLESWFLRCSIEKAHRIDVPDLSARPLTTPLLDDVFYLVRLVLSRAVATSNVNVISTMCRNVRYIIDEDFMQAIVRTLDGVLRNSTGSMAVDGPRKDAASREIRTTFGVYLNVLSTAAEYLTRILNELSSEYSLEQQFTGTDLAVVASTLQGLSVLVPRLRNAVRTHMDLLFATLVRPRLRQLVSESVREVNFVLNENDFAHAEDEAAAHGGHDPFVRRMMRGWETIILAAGYRDLLTAENWELLLRLAIDAIVRAWESWAMNAQYSELGALRFDKDVRTVSTFLAAQSATGGLRERFGRLTHISYLVNLDEDEDEDGNDAIEPERSNAATAANNDDDVAWRLTADEMRQVRQRRVGW